MGHAPSRWTHALLFISNAYTNLALRLDACHSSLAIVSHVAQTNFNASGPSPLKPAPLRGKIIRKLLCHWCNTILSTSFNVHPEYLPLTADWVSPLPYAQHTPPQISSYLILF
ncbi:hypothetical protein JB92DRAFT_2918899 [Gautieria morchelliformis]|nr:hypothetical protein JB92DRAFT_2918899 [Gautieria morchelliformis]